MLRIDKDILYISSAVKNEEHKEEMDIQEGNCFFFFKEFFSFRKTISMDKLMLLYRSILSSVLPKKKGHCQNPKD